MIRNADPSESATVTVTLRDGTVYENKDFGMNVFSDTEKFVSFYLSETDLMVVPAKEIKSIVFHLE